MLDTGARRHSARGPRFDSWRGVRREVIYLRKAGNRHYINIFEDSPIYKKKLHEINTHTHTHTRTRTHTHTTCVLTWSVEPPLNDGGLVCCDVLDYVRGSATPDYTKRQATRYL